MSSSDESNNKGEHISSEPKKVSRRTFVKKHLKIVKEKPPEPVDEENEEGRESIPLIKEMDHSYANKETMKKEEKEIQKKLVEIYENSDGSMPDMKTFKKKKKYRFATAFFVLLFSCVFLGTVAWAGFFLFQPKTDFSENDVIVSVSGDEQTTPGGEVHYRIRYRNGQHVPLAQTNIQIRYPQGFTFSSSSIPATNDTHDEWTLGVLNPDEGGYLDITGTMYADVGSEQSIRAFFNYKPANFSSEFQKVSVLAVKVQDSPVEFTVVAPDQVSPGRDVELVITAKAKEGATIGKTTFVLDPGIGFTKKSSEPVSDAYQAYQWTFDSLAEAKTVKVVGSFAKNNEDKQHIIVRVLGHQNDTIQDDGFIIATQEKDIAFSEMPVEINLAINGSMDNMSVAPGDVLNATISVKNLSQAALAHATIKFILDNPSANKKSILNWNKLDDKADGTITGEQVTDEVRRGSITWDETNISALASVAPDAEVKIDVSIPIKNGDETSLSDFTSDKMSGSVEVQYDKGEGKEIIKSNNVEMIINSDFGFEVRDDVSSDSSGQEVHTVTWLLNNTYHDLKNIQLDADVYGNVQWDATGLSVPAGEVKYDEKTKHIVWKVPTMSNSTDVLALKFAIVIPNKNPTQTTLVSKVTAKATDVVTNMEITKTGDEIALK
jgi:hypothetical protein